MMLTSQRKCSEKMQQRGGKASLGTEKFYILYPGSDTEEQLHMAFPVVSWVSLQITLYCLNRWLAAWLPTGIQHWGPSPGDSDSIALG